MTGSLKIRARAWIRASGSTDSARTQQAPDRPGARGQLLTPDAIRRQIDLPDPIAPGVRDRCRSLMLEDQDLGNMLEMESSDLLLVARLPRMARIFTHAPPSKEPGIARIRDIAEAYLKTQAKVDPDA